MEKTQRNIKKKRRKRRNHTFVVLTRLMLCLAIVSTVVIVSFKLAVKSYSEVVVSEINNEINNKDEKNVSIKEDESIQGKKDDNFDDVTLINDNRGVPVICYHSINNDPSGKSSIIISKDKFRQQLQTIKDNGYMTLTMAQLNDYLYKDKPIPEKSLVITFDDGYRDNYTNAFPILKEFNMNATIFVISSYINRELYLTTNEIIEMSDYGIDIESHTVSHVKLSTLSYENQVKELKESRDALEKITNKPIIAIAYPEGKYNKDTQKAVVEAGYSMGFTTERGYADRSDKSTQLNRICVDYTYKPNNMLKILKNLRK